MDPLNQDDRSRFYTRERVSALVTALGKVVNMHYSDTAGLLLELLRKGLQERTVAEPSQPLNEAFSALERLEKETGMPSLFSGSGPNRKISLNGLSLSFYGQYVYRTLKEWGESGDFRLLSEMVRNARYSRNETEMEEAIEIVTNTLRIRHKEFSARMAAIESGRRAVAFHPLIEEADRLSKELLDGLRILKACFEDGTVCEEGQTVSILRCRTALTEKPALMIEGAERFLRKVLSIVEVYESVRENEYEQLLTPESRGIHTQVIPAMLAPHTSFSSREAYRGFFRMLIPPKTPLRLCFATRLITRAESTIKKANPIRRKPEKTPFDPEVLLFFLTLLKQVRTGRTTLSEIMRKIPMTEGLSALFMRVHLVRDLWFQNCAFRELDEALRRKRMKNDYLGIQIESSGSTITVGHYHMNDLSFRLMGRRG